MQHEKRIIEYEGRMDQVEGCVETFHAFVVLIHSACAIWNDRKVRHTNRHIKNIDMSLMDPNLLKFGTLGPNCPQTISALVLLEVHGVWVDRPLQSGFSQGVLQICPGQMKVILEVLWA